MIWFHRSQVFEMALSGEWTEKKEKKMVLKDCSAEALKVAVNFIYGISVPEDFTQYGDLLHLAELFQMENLKEVVVERLARNLSKENYLLISKIAEMYNATRLAEHCAHFVHEEMSVSDEIDWKEMGKLPSVIAAFGKKAMGSKSPLIWNRREDFESVGLYERFVAESVQEGSIVRLRADLEVINLRRAFGLKVGHLGKVVSKEVSGPGLVSGLKVLFNGKQDWVSVSSLGVEVLTPQTIV